jgi:M6 family metalloprotease-like protein
MIKSLKLSVQPYFLSLFVIIVISLFVLHSNKAHATDKQKSNASPASQNGNQIAKLTTRLNSLLANYRHATVEDKAAIEDQLISTANERRDLLADVVLQAPETALTYALPSALHKQFPKLVQDLLEQRIAAEGTLEVFFEDHDQSEDSRLHYYLKQDKKRFTLSIAHNKQPAIKSGQKVLVQGVMFHNNSDDETPVIALNSDQLMLAAGGSADPTITSSPAILDNTFGEQRTAVFLVNFKDKPSEMPWSPSQVYDRFFTQISNFFMENSYQQTWLTGDVFGWYTANINSTDSCNQWAIAQAADDAAIANNVDLSQYDRYVYVFPYNTCSWSGFATVGGTQTQAWVRGDLFTKVPAHELGHNFGLLHSHGLNCQGDATETNCVSLTYGDQLDTMGAQPGHFNAYQKERLGWLNQGNMPAITTVQQSGSYTIEPLETNSNNAKALKVLRDTDPATGQNRWFYIEQRQSIGEDQFISSDPYLNDANINNGVIIHMATEQDGNSSFLLDMTPESTTLSSNFADLYDPALVSGSSFTDSVTGITFSNQYTTSQSAGVAISFNGSPTLSCTHNDPQLSVSPIESQWLQAGATAVFTVNLTNQDNSACPSSTFQISDLLPTGWTSADTQLTLSPGQSGSSSISVTSANSANDGFYSIAMSALNTDASSYSAQTSVTYVVTSTSANSAPLAADDSVIMTQIAPVTINVLQNDFDPDNDALYIAGIGSAAKGDVSVNADGSLVYTPAKPFKDSDSFSYTISDGQASATAMVYLSLQSDTSGGGGNPNGGGSTKGGGKPTK